ncbi:hypothetical protein PQU95_10270 [Vogesella sp. DC21W]|uniref:Uncharacterized protein n=1 Tax=Vogesella aquatica TaxID=2984206 RepID=A0ABT5IYG6_9NEIS|nr:hypothetical protein [Vogesella aquatica]MDC7717595.1 hypothetical protein [Vogesella aquatica]
MCNFYKKSSLLVLVFILSGNIYADDSGWSTIGQAVSGEFFEINRKSFKSEGDGNDDNISIVAREISREKNEKTAKYFKLSMPRSSCGELFGRMEIKSMNNQEVVAYKYIIGDKNFFDLAPPYICISDSINKTINTIRESVKNQKLNQQNTMNKHKAP